MLTSNKIEEEEEDENELVINELAVTAIEPHWIH
jgi:hypothetical protein